MRIRGLDRVRAALRPWQVRFFGGAVVLLYHRVAEITPDPWSLCVSPRHFAEHLDVIRRFRRPLSLTALVAALQNGGPPRGSVVVTFDDGYADNLHSARPILETYDVPATVFITARAVGQSAELWWDELGRILLEPGDLPPTLWLDIDGVRHEWALDGGAHYSEEASRRDRRWTWSQPPPSIRQELYRTLYTLLHRRPDLERAGLLRRLAQQASLAPEARPTHRTVSTEELVTLGAGDLVEIGAHSVSHPILSSLELPAQRDEIEQSKRYLEELLGRPVTSFAYPHGGRTDYTPDTVALVRKAGFAHACTAFSGVVGRSTDVFQLPRVTVDDWDGDRLAAHLSSLTAR